MITFRHFIISIYIHNHGHCDRVPMSVTSSHPKQAQLDTWYWQRRRGMDSEDYGVDLEGIDPAFAVDEYASDYEEYVGMCSLLAAWATHYAAFVKEQSSSVTDPIHFIPMEFTRADGSIDWMEFWTSDHTLPATFEAYITHPKRLDLMSEGQAAVVSWMAGERVDDSDNYQQISLGGAVEITAEQFSEWIRVEEALKFDRIVTLP